MSFPIEQADGCEGNWEMQIFVKMVSVWRHMFSRWIGTENVQNVKFMILDGRISAGPAATRSMLGRAAGGRTDPGRVQHPERSRRCIWSYGCVAGMQQPSQSSPAPSLMPNPNPEAGGSMDVDEGEGNEMAPPLNVPPLAMGALAAGTQNEREEERETSFENREGQIVEVHPLSSPRDPAVVIPLLGVPFSPSGGLGNVSVHGQSTARNIGTIVCSIPPHCKCIVDQPNQCEFPPIDRTIASFCSASVGFAGGGSVQPLSISASN